jgi:hypothetical protein
MHPPVCRRNNHSVVALQKETGSKQNVTFCDEFLREGDPAAWVNDWVA